MSRARNRLANVCATALCLVLSGCHSYQLTEAPTPQLAIGTGRPQMRFTMKDGKVFEVRRASMNGDSIRGENIFTERELNLSRDSVRTFETWKYDGQRTVLAVVGSFAGLVGGFLLLLSGASGDDWIY